MRFPTSQSRKAVAAGAARVAVQAAAVVAGRAVVAVRKVQRQSPPAVPRDADGAAVQVAAVLPEM